jgi:hypothetical protein
VDNESELPATEETDSGRNRRKTNANGLPLTQSGRVSIGRNDINAKYDAALFGAEIPLEGAGDY